tara:strand:+ start:499 stop:696 length:198 start_codon:yes stop_codon:yes gene_type:complete
MYSAGIYNNNQTEFKYTSNSSINKYASSKYTNLEDLIDPYGKWKSRQPTPEYHKDENKGCYASSF